MTARTDRDDRRHAFLGRCGWGDAEVEALPSDASFRRYYRLHRGTDRAMLMDAPPDKEDVRLYVTVARHLVSLGLSAPRIEAADEADGFVLIEDFGDATYTRLLDGGADPEPLYAMAVDVLAAMHGEPRATEVDVPPYDTPALLDEAALLADWYLPAMTGRATVPDVRAAWLDAWRIVFDAMPPARESLVLRDYHVDNLMLLDGRNGVAACGLLDFQDALIGPCAYDLVSLLEDARRDVTEELTRAMRVRYADAVPDVAGPAFDAWYTVLGAQRHAKVAGIFVRLCVRDGKPVYLPHIPRVMRLLAGALDREADRLAPVHRWFDAHLPDLSAPLPDFDPAAVRALVTAS